MKTLVLILTLAIATLGFSQKMLELDASSNGKTVTVKPGQAIQIMLDSNITTGFSWVVSKVSGQVKQMGEPTYIGPNNPRLGAGGRQMFKFEALKKGTGTIELAYKRSWEKVAPAKTFKLKLIVKKK